MFNKIGIIGLGVVGNAIFESFNIKGIKIICYDKFKNGGIDSLQDLLNCELIFLCLPTFFDEEINMFNKYSINETCETLKKLDFNGLIVLKSTVEPETTEKLSNKYSLRICHNPEFLSAKTAFLDFHNQRHIVIGKGINCLDKDIELLKIFYSTYYPSSEISICNSIESESMKIFCNSFYASKIMLFNEYYLLCQKNNSDFNIIKNLMLKNNWINPMHTNIPGPDGNLAFGGVCFPKDTNALLHYMKKYNSESNVLESVIKECNDIRNK